MKRETGRGMTEQFSERRWPGMGLQREKCVKHGLALNSH